MNATEAAVLCRFVKACCPQQKFDELSPDAWALLLSDVTLVDAKEAAITVAKRQPWVAPAEILAEVYRSHRGAAFSLGHIIPPRELADLPHRENAWKRTLRTAVVDGCDEARAIQVANASQGITPDDEPLAIDAGQEAIAAIKVISMEVARNKSFSFQEVQAKRAEESVRYRVAKAARRAEQDEANKGETL